MVVSDGLRSTLTWCKVKNCPEEACPQTPLEDCTRTDNYVRRAPHQSPLYMYAPSFFNLWIRPCVLEKSVFYVYLTAASVSLGLPTQFVHCCLVTAIAFRPVGRGGSRGFARTHLLAFQRFYTPPSNTF